MTRRGVTLVALLVTLAVLGIAAGIGGLAVATWTAPAPPATPASRLAAARRAAISAGRAVTITDTIGGARRAATAFADGRVVADSGFGDASP